MPFDDSPERFRNNYLKIREAIHSSENNIIFGLLDINEYPLELTEDCSNQIFIMYRTGRFEVLPRGVNGAAIRDYVGIAYHRIVGWTALPRPGAKGHPIHLPKQVLSGTAKDIYECE